MCRSTEHSIAISPILLNCERPIFRETLIKDILTQRRSTKVRRNVTLLMNGVSVKNKRIYLQLTILNSIVLCTERREI